MEERASKSPTLDRDKSHRNAYWHRDGGPSGTATWEAMCEAAAAYKIPVTLKNGKTAERGLRGDAVIGWAAILKPPPEMVAELGMAGKDVKRFCSDGFKALGQIEPRLFRLDNMEAVAGHIDEGTGHYHFVGTSKDKAGKYCGNLIDANLCVRINEQFPALMRGMGWPIDDIDLTDWERMATDEEYRKEREAKRKRQGTSVAAYAKQRAEKAGEVAARIITDAKAEAQAVKAQAVQDAKEDIARAKAQAVQDGMAEAREKANKEFADTYFATAELKREMGDMTEYRRWKAQKDAQEAQEAARKEQEAQEARERQEAARKAQEAQEAARKEQEAQAAREAEKRRQEAGGLLSEDEMMAEFRRRMGYTTPKAEQPKQPEPPKPPKPEQPEGGSALSRLRALAEQSARKQQQRTKDEGPSCPGA